MTALPNVPNVVKIVFFGPLGAYNWANVMHAQWTGTTPNSTALTALGADLAAVWNSDMKAQVLPQCTLQTVTLTDLTTSSGAVGVDTPAIVGTNAGSTLTNNAAILVNFPSSFRYRGGHPRLYLPPSSTANLTNDSTWASGLVTNINTYINALQSAMNGATSGGTTLAGQCAVSYYSTAITPTPPHRRVTPVIMPIAPGSFTTEAHVASQRRRVGRK
jgi:hypothetical protein